MMFRVSEGSQNTCQTLLSQMKRSAVYLAAQYSNLTLTEGNGGVLDGSLTSLVPLCVQTQTHDGQLSRFMDTSLIFTYSSQSAPYLGVGKSSLGTNLRGK